MKATKANLIKLAKSYGVTDELIDDLPGLSPQGFDMTFYLPVGLCWASDGQETHCIVASQWDCETKAECITDAMDRMTYGVELCRCNECKSQMTSAEPTCRDCGKRLILGVVCNECVNSINKNAIKI
jgi:hypothetical protein